MALRLAGEDYSVVQGLDGLGWLRDINVSSSDPALKVDQKGAGSILDLLDNGTAVLRVLNGGNLGFLAGKALTAGQYEIGRNNDATNRLQLNVPTGASIEFSVNGVEASIINNLGFKAIAGSNASPSYSFINDPDTGLWNDADKIHFATGGSERMVIDGTQLYLTVPIRNVEGGSAASPTYTWAADNDTGIYRAGADQIGFSTGSGLRMSLSNTELDLSTLFAEFGEIADPAAPAADRARLFSKDNGAGKTQLVVRFPTGAVQVLATEP